MTADGAVARPGGAPGAPPATVAVVGLGLIGGSLCAAMRRRLPATRIVGITRNPTAIEGALRSGVCDDAGPDEALLDGADVAVLCTPVDAMPRWLRACAARPALLVTDAGSTKAWVGAQAAPLLGGRFLGGHPMAGRERSGWAAADPDLFDGCTWVLTPENPGALERFGPWVAVVEALGARVVLLDAAVHDAATALVSHMPFTVSAALMRAVDGADAWEAGWLLASTGLRDMVRLAGGEPAMEAAILATNADHVIAALDRVLDELAGLRSRLGDRDGVRLWFAEARERRAGWLERRRVAGRPVP